MTTTCKWCKEPISFHGTNWYHEFEDLRLRWCEDGLHAATPETSAASTVGEDLLKLEFGISKLEKCVKELEEKNSALNRDLFEARTGLLYKRGEFVARPLVAPAPDPPYRKALAWLYTHVSFYDSNRKNSPGWVYEAGRMARNEERRAGGVE